MSSLGSASVGVPNSRWFWNATPLGTSGSTATVTSLVRLVPTAAIVTTAVPTPAACRLPNGSTVTTAGSADVNVTSIPGTGSRKSSSTFTNSARS